MEAGNSPVQIEEIFRKYMEIMHGKWNFVLMFLNIYLDIPPKKSKLNIHLFKQK